MHPDAALHIKNARRLAWGGVLLGFSLGGFFDGILLHQILQWHHLLSGVAPGDTVTDLRLQILADGVFHLMHYVLAVWGMGMLWLGRSALWATGAGRRLMGWSLVGFGSWHVFDGVVSHWLLQIHRIRMDVDNPLFWDLLWFIPFGVVALGAGVWLLRTTSHGGKSGAPSRGRGAATALGLAALFSGPVAALPPSASVSDGMSLVVFHPGVTFADVVAAADAVEGSLVWSDDRGGVWLIALGPDASAASLYRHGAILVSNGAVAVGCLSWTEV